MQAFVQALMVSHISLPVCLGLWEICGWLNNVNFTTCRNSALYKHNCYYYYKCGCRNIHSYAIESFYMIVIATDFFLGCCYNFSLENASERHAQVWEIHFRLRCLLCFWRYWLHWGTCSGEYQSKCLLCSSDWKTRPGGDGCRRYSCQPPFGVCCWKST